MCAGGRFLRLKTSAGGPFLDQADARCQGDDKYSRLCFFFVSSSMKRFRISNKKMPGMLELWVFQNE